MQVLSLTGGWSSHDDHEDLSGEEDSDDDDKEKVSNSIPCQLWLLNHFKPTRLHPCFRIISAPLHFLDCTFNFSRYFTQEGKMSLKERLHAIQEVTQSVQNSIGHIASLGESIKK